jgi:restriction endonuclease S subunit
MTLLRELGEWSGGNAPSKANAAYWDNGTVPWVSPKDMKVNEIASSEDRITEQALEDGRVSMVPAGSVLFVTRSGILAHTFPVAVTKLPVTINQDLKALSPKASVSPKYVAHAVRGASQRILKQCSKHGTTVASVDTKALLDFEIPMVALDEQNLVVAEIEKQFSRLDEAVANLQRVKANLKAHRRTVLRDTFETVEGATPRTLADVSEVVSGFAFKGGDFVTGGIPVVKIANVGYGEFSYKDQEYLPAEFLARYQAFTVRPGDLLLALTRPVTEGTLKVCRYPVGAPPAMQNQRVAVLRAPPADADYLLALMHSPQRVAGDERASRANW